MIFSTTIQNFDGPVWGRHITLPLDVVQSLKSQKISRVICTLNGQEAFHTGLMPDGNGSFFITLNKALVKKLALDIGSEVEVSLKEDTSKYGMPMPEELEELLIQDAEGDKHFHALTMGKQRNLIYIVNQAKRSETRLYRAVVIIDYLKSTNGRLDFKELHQALKDSRS